jgi:hypothetical protein
MRRIGPAGSSYLSPGDPTDDGGSARAILSPLVTA